MTRLRTADGVDLHVEVEGSGPVTVVLAHGWTMDARTWSPVAARLADRCRVVRYDLRGHGRSAPVPAEAMTLPRLADDLAELVAACPPGPVVLAGHSMGGMTVMALAERHPDIVARVAGVAFVATASGGLDERPFGLTGRRRAALLHGQEWLAGRSWWLRRGRLARHPRLLAPGVRYLLLGRGAPAGATALVAGCLADSRPASVTGFLPALSAHDRDGALGALASTPATVLVGSRDRLTPPSAARRVLAALPAAEFVELAGAGHMLPVERPAAVAERVATLVQGAG